MKSGGGSPGYLSKSNLEYLLDAIRDIGERLDRKHAIIKKASFLLFNVITLHPFLNGNKRTSYELARLFLRLNGYEITSKSGETYLFLLKIGAGKASADEVDRWIARNLAEFKE